MTNIDEAIARIEMSRSRTIAAQVEAGCVRIRPMKIDDAPALQEAGRDPAVFRYVPAIATPFDAMLFCTKALRSPENYVCHAVEVAQTGEVIGYTQIGRRNNCDIELGYWISATHWGKGYGSLAARAAVHLLRQAGSNEPVYAATYPDNVPSRRILANLGFSETDQSECPPGMIDHVLTR